MLRALVDWAKGGLCVFRAAVRCNRAQVNGGVIFMSTGSALFDAVAISDTAAGGWAAVRVGADAHRGGGRRTECGPMRPGEAASAVRRLAAWFG